MNLRLSCVVVVLALMPFALTSCAGESTAPTPSTTQQTDSHLPRHASSPCPCIYVASSDWRSSGAAAVTVYPTNATGNASPMQIISGSNTELDRPTGIAVDGKGNMYVANSAGGPRGLGFVAVYAAGATGNVPPIRTIGGPKTGLHSPYGIALDPINGDIYVSNYQGRLRASVTFYPARAHGNVSPIGVITGENTRLRLPRLLALDASGNIYVPSARSYGLSVYAAGSVGNVSPIRGINEPKQQFLDIDLALDSNADIYVAARKRLGKIYVFAAGTSGLAAPTTRLIYGERTGLVVPSGIAVDSNKNIYVSNLQGGYNGLGSVTVYAPGTRANVKPIQIITGSNTGLNGPNGIVVR